MLEILKRKTAMDRVMDGIALLATLPSDEEMVKHILRLLTENERQNLSITLITLNGLIQVVNMEKRNNTNSKRK